MLGVLFSGLAAIVKIAGPVVTSFATQLVAKLPTIVETALEVLKVVGPIVKDVAGVIGVLKNGDDVEELGKKAMQEGGPSVNNSNIVLIRLPEKVEWD